MTDFSASVKITCALDMWEPPGANILTFNIMCGAIITTQLANLSAFHLRMSYYTTYLLLILLCFAVLAITAVRELLHINKYLAISLVLFALEIRPKKFDFVCHQIVSHWCQMSE